MFSLALAIAAFGLGASASPLAKRNVTNTADFQIINLARNLESLELNYWDQVLANYTDANFTDAGYPGFRDYVTLFRDQEIQHFTALNTVLDGGFVNCTYNFPVYSLKNALEMAQVITTVGEGAFIGGVANLTESALRLTGASILGNEARQNSKLREELGLDYFNAINFDTPLTPSQAYSLAEPLFSCPASNPPINYKLIPPIMANFTMDPGGNTTRMTGDMIDIMWDPSAFFLGNDVFISFLSDTLTISADFNQTGNGTGVTTLPPFINGTAILVATTFSGLGPIPDENNYGIGYLVVA